MCKSLKSRYSIEKNVQNWIVVAAFYAVMAFTLPFEDPMIVWIFGISLGYMTMWAQEIFYHWVKSKY